MKDTQKSQIDIAGMLNAYKLYFTTRKFLLLLYCVIGIVIFYIAINNQDYIEKSYPHASIILIPVYILSCGAFIGMFQIIFGSLFGYVILPILSDIFEGLGKWFSEASKGIKK